MYSGLAYLGPWNVKKGTEPLKEIAQANYTSVDDRITSKLEPGMLSPTEQSLR
jgi:hypothetical protein